MKIDIVYTWVDGSDPDWRNRKLKRAKEVGNILPDSNFDFRFMDNDELKYSLRSVEKFAPWVNNIFIVTDNQIPGWLDTSHPKINIVDHSEIFSDKKKLPTFSARGIESQIHHIKNLQEHFIYFNDDMFLGNFCTPEYFFTKNGLPRIFVSEIIPIPNRKAFDISLRPENKRNNHQYAIVNTRKLIKEKFNKSVYSNIRHGIKPLLKSVLAQLEDIFNEKITNTSSNSFRTNDDILMFHLFNYYAIIKKLGKTKYVKTVDTKKKLLHQLTAHYNKFTFGYINLHEKDVDEHLSKMKEEKPFTFCLNQTENTPEKNLIKIKNFLKDYFPLKSSFEK